MQRFDYMLLSALSHNLVSAIFLHILLLFISKKFIFSVHCHEFLEYRSTRNHLINSLCLDVRGALAAKPPFSTLLSLCYPKQV